MATININQKNVSDNNNTFFRNNRILIGTEMPLTGDYVRGDIIVNSGSDNDENSMWICIESGSPGDWISIGRKPLITAKARVTITDTVDEVSTEGLGELVEKNDKLDVYLNSTYLLEDEDYSISKDGTKIIKKSGFWNTTKENAIFDFVLMKQVHKVDSDNITINAKTKLTSIVTNVPIIGTQTEVAIPNNFNETNDTLLIFKNGIIMVNDVDYQISNGNIVSLTGPWNQSNVDDYEMTFILLKEVLVYEGGASGDFQEKIDSNLQTNDKTVVGAINELFQSANNGKQLIANAIGEPLNAEDTFSAMSDKINVMKSDLKQMLTEEGVSVTEEDNIASLIGKVDEEFDKQVVPVGTATASDVLSGKTFINSTGSTVTGTITNQGSKTITPSTSNQTLPAGYYSGITINGDSDLKASNIRKGYNLFGVSGTLVAFQTIQYQGVGVYSNIAYNGATYTGSVQYNSSGIYNYPVVAVCTYDMTITSSYKLTGQVSTITFDATVPDNVFQNGGSSGYGSTTTSLDMSIDRSVSGVCSYTLKVGGNGGSIYVKSVSLYMLRP